MNSGRRIILWASRLRALRSHSAASRLDPGYMDPYLEGLQKARQLVPHSLPGNESALRVDSRRPRQRATRR